MIEAPVPWTRFDEHGARPFTTTARFRRADGAIVDWESRLYRKHHNLLDNHRGTTWCAPGAIGWWIAVLFMFGSACFALGAMPGYLGAVGAEADGVTYFVGSVFFTSAALLQYLEMANTPTVDGAGVAPGRIRFLLWQPHRIDWCASSVQLVGTLFFNISTAHALLSSLDARQIDQLVWRPDVLGSVCFLVASGFAWAEVGHRWVSWRPRDISWWIAGLNLAGSVAFGVSAVAAYVIVDSGLPVNAELANAGTFVGAVCFLGGAFLLLPERTHPTE